MAWQRYIKKVVSGKMVSNLFKFRSCYQVSKEQVGEVYLFFVPLPGHKASLVVNLLT